MNRRRFFAAGMAVLGSFVVGCSGGGGLLSAVFSGSGGTLDFNPTVGQSDIDTDGAFLYNVDNSQNAVTKRDPTKPAGQQVVAGPTNTTTTPRRVVTDRNGSVYVAEYDGAAISTIEKFSTTNTTLTQVNVTPNTTFNFSAVGLAAGPNGILYVLDQPAAGSYRITTLNAQLQSQASVTVAAGVLTAPNNIAVDTQGRVYVADGTGSSSTVVRLTGTGARDTTFNLLGIPVGALTEARDVAAGSNGRVFVATANTILVLDGSGRSITTTLNVTGGTALNNPASLAADPSNRLWVTQPGQTLFILTPTQ